MSAATIVYRQGHKFNALTAQILDCANYLLSLEANGAETSDMSIMQGSYNTDVQASGGTHAGGGAGDVSPHNHKNRVKVLRKLGCAAWYRPAISGLWSAHVHFIVDGDPTASDAAKQQVRDYHNRLNGLANRGPDDGYRMSVFPRFAYGAAKVRRIVRLHEANSYYQPNASSGYITGKHPRGFVWPASNLAKVYVDDRAWLVSRSGSFFLASQHLPRPIGFVSAPGGYMATKAPAYGRMTADLSSRKMVSYSVGQSFTGLGYVDRPYGRFILDYRGYWFAATSFVKL